MSQLKFLSKADQVVKTLEAAVQGNISDGNWYSDLIIHMSEMIISEFAFLDYLELDGYLNDRYDVPYLDLLLSVIDARVSEIRNLLDREIIKARISLNEGDYVLFLLNRKRETRSFRPNSKIVSTLYEYYLLEIHSGIIRNKSVLQNHLKQDFSNDSDAMNLFLVYPKVEALTRYENYVFKQVAKYGIETVAQNLHVKMGRARDLIGQNHIPRIDHLNYMKEEIFANENGEYITFDEISALLKDQNYFKEVLPLSRLEEKELIHPDKDFIDKKFTLFLLESYFREKLGLVSDQHGNKLIDVFVSSIFTLNAAQTFKKHVLIDGQRLISKHLSTKPDFQNFIAILCHLSDHDFIINATAKFPKILAHYVSSQAYSESTIKDYLTRERKEMKEAKDKTHMWFLGKVTQYHIGNQNDI